MDRLAAEMDQVMARMQAVDEQANVYGGCGPRLNEEKDPSEWLGQRGRARPPSSRTRSRRARRSTTTSSSSAGRKADPTALGHCTRSYAGRAAGASCHAFKILRIEQLQVFRRAMALELRNLTKRVGAETHIHETNLVLAEKGFNILLGTTLSGKTTLMQLMAGIDQPSSGEIWFKGRDMTGMPVQKRNVAMVYQQFINYPNFTVYENIASPLRVAKVPKEELGDRVAQVAALMQLAPMLKRMPSELSGGQQQRVAIARALVKDAELVLLDEPLANLDYKLREELRDELPQALRRP